MKFEKLNGSMFQQISFDEMNSIQGGVGGTITLHNVHTTMSSSGHQLDLDAVSMDGECS
jgi:bacteriocin-like protein